MPTTPDYETADYVNELFDRLEDYRERRARLLRYSGLFVLGAVFMLAFLRLARFSAALLLIGTLATVIAASVVGLYLLAAFTRNESEARALEREVREFRVRTRFGVNGKAKRKKRKPATKDVTYFTVGPDGELVEMRDNPDAASDDADDTPDDHDETEQTQSSRS
jgi:hypothetical protein